MNRSATRRSFNALLQAEDITYLMEAHDGISAKIAEATGFGAIWASGFSISTILGVRDCSEMSWTDLLTAVKRIVNSCDVPVIVDGDTGYGNFNTARRVSRELEQAGAHGICLEDKQFPKLNSFVDGDHDLVPKEEFVGKLEACVDAKTNPNFSLIARTESLIAGRSHEEAIDRAHAYFEAGADAIFLHSRSDTFDEIAEVATQIDSGIPLLISPTTYEHAAAVVLRECTISGVIWANQSMRAAVASMWTVCEELLSTYCAQSLSTPLAPLDDIFSLLDYEQLAIDEQRYTPRPLKGAVGL